MSRWEPKACDEKGCLRVAAEKVYRDNPARFNYLCEKHLPVPCKCGHNEHGRVCFRECEQ